MWIGKIQNRIFVEPVNQFFTDIAAGGEVLFNGGSDYTGPQGNAAGSKLADQNSGRLRLGLFCCFHKGMRIDDLGENLTGMIQIRFVSNLNIQKIGIDRILIKVTVVNDTQIHLGIWYDHTAIVIYIADNGVPQIDGLDIAGDLHTIDGHIYPVADIKGLEKGKDKAMYNIG